MKNVFSLNLTDYSASDVGGDLGRIRQEGAKFYKLVKNNTASAFVVGDVTFINSPALDSTQASAIACTTALLGCMAGVAISAIPAAQYGWILIEGYYATVHIEGTTDIVIYDWLIGSNGQVYAVKGQTLGTAPAYRKGIIALLGYTTNGESTVAGYVHCM